MLRYGTKTHVLSLQQKSAHFVCKIREKKKMFATFIRKSIDFPTHEYPKKTNPPKSEYRTPKI